MRKAIVLATALNLVLVGLAWAAVKDKKRGLDLTFHTQIETDFEYRTNYDFSDTVANIQGRQEEFFVEQESRFWMDAKAGPFSSRIMFEAEVFWDTSTAEGGGTGKDIAVEQAWGAYDFGFVNARVGNQVFRLDPAGIAYVDDDYGIRLWESYEWGGWNVFWSFTVEGSDTSVTTPNQDRHFIMASADIKVGNPWTVTPFVAGVLDNSRSTLSGQATDNLDAAYLGAAVKGSIAGLKLLGEIVYVTGNIECAKGSGTTAGACHPTSATGSTITEKDIGAIAGVASVAYAIPDFPLTVEAGGVWMSGDENPIDGDADGYQGMFQDAEIFNGQGIWLDDDIRIAPKSGGVAQVCDGAAGSGCSGVFQLTSDDDFSPDGGDLNFDARGTTNVFSTTSPTNPGNFGIQYYHVGAHYQALNPKLTLSVLYAHIRAMETGLLGGDAEIGNEITLHAVWKPHKFLRVTPTFSALIPGEAIENLTGTDETAYNITVETMFLF